MGDKAGRFSIMMLKKRRAGLALEKSPRTARTTTPPRKEGAPLQIITTLAELVAAVLGGYAAWLAIRAHRNRPRR